MRRLVTAFFMLTTPAMAQEAPRVVADIAPIRALTAQIMQGVGSPDQIIPTGASPHGYAMRPSEARALGAADLVIWVGPALTHWLEEPLDSLASDAARLTLMEVAQTESLPMREAEEMGDHEGHDDHEKHEEDHDKHDDHDDHEGEDHADHDKHEEGHDDHDDHEGEEHADHDENHDKHEEEGHDDHEEAHDGGHDHHGVIDPHAWLSPSTAVVWAGAIAQQLSEVDPANAATYAQNLEGLKSEITALEQELEAALAPYKDKNFIVLHDAYQYFEVAFDFKADAFVFAGDAQTPGPKTVQNLREHLSEHPAVCAFIAPQENDALMRTVIEGQGTRVAVLDPLGDGQQPYATLLRSFAENMAECFGAE